MQIKRIKASNIFSYENIDIQLNKFNVLIGPNASGKTNFVNIIKFIKDLISEGLSDAISIQGGINIIRNINLGASKNTSIEFQIECEEMEDIMIFMSSQKTSLGFKICDFTYKLEIGYDSKNSNNWFINLEDISTSVEIYEAKIIKKRPPKIEEILSKLQINFKNKKGKYTSNYTETKKIPKYKELLNLIISSRFAKSEESYLDKSILEGETITPILYPIRSFLEKITLYNIDRKLIKSEMLISGKRDLHPNGQNLPIVLDNILSNPYQNKKFISLVRDFLPFINRFFIKKKKKKITGFEFQEIFNKPEVYLPSFLMSDGTIDITLFIIIMFFEKKPFIVIEEPVSNIHPYLISKLVSIMEDVSDNLSKQILITTHNPEIIKYAGKDNILVVKRDKNGFSGIYRPSDKEELKTFLKNNLGIDDLFIENLL